MKEAGVCIVCGHIEGAAKISLDRLISHCRRCLSLDARWLRLHKESELVKRIELMQAQVQEYQAVLDDQVGHLERLQRHIEEHANA